MARVPSRRMEQVGSVAARMTATARTPWIWCNSVKRDPHDQLLEPASLLGLVATLQRIRSRAALAVGLPPKAIGGLLAVQATLWVTLTAWTLRCTPSRCCRQPMIWNRLRACRLPF